MTKTQAEIQAIENKFNELEESGSLDPSVVDYVELLKETIITYQGELFTKNSEIGRLEFKVKKLEAEARCLKKTIQNETLSVTEAQWELLVRKLNSSIDNEYNLTIVRDKGCYWPDKGDELGQKKHTFKEAYDWLIERNFVSDVLMLNRRAKSCLNPS